MYNVGYPFNSIFEAEDPFMVKSLVKDGKANLVSSTRLNKEPVKGKRVAIFCNLISDVGGIETLLYNVHQSFPQADITLYFGVAQIETLLELIWNWNIVRYDGGTIEADICIMMNCDSWEVLIDKVKAAKKYCFYGHQDWRVFKDIKQDDFWHMNQLDKDAIGISVSKSAQGGVKEVLGLDTKVVSNQLYTEEPIRIFTSTRLTRDKGSENLLLMVDEMHHSGINFVWFITVSKFSNPEVIKQLKLYREVVLVDGGHASKHLIKGMDWCIITSPAEAFCYAAYEAHQFGVPVIMLECDQAHAIADKIYKQDLQDFNPQDLTKPPKDITKPTITTDEWAKLLDGKI
jgi:hypothetical protein